MSIYTKEELSKIMEEQIFSYLKINEITFVLQDKETYDALQQLKITDIEIGESLHHCDEESNRVFGLYLYLSLPDTDMSHLSFFHKTSRNSDANTWVINGYFDSHPEYYKNTVDDRGPENELEAMLLDVLINNDELTTLLDDAIDKKIQFDLEKIKNQYKRVVTDEKFNVDVLLLEDTLKLNITDELGNILIEEWLVGKYITEFKW